MMDDSTLIGKIVTFVMVGILGWLAFTVQQMSIEQAVQGAQVEAIQEAIAATNLDRYTRSEALSDRAVLETRLERVEIWSQNLSNRLADVEDFIRSGNTPDAQ